MQDSYYLKKKASKRTHFWEEIQASQRQLRHHHQALWNRHESSLEREESTG